jgi:hypothetical protein
LPQKTSEISGVLMTMMQWIGRISASRRSTDRH